MYKSGISAISPFSSPLIAIGDHGFNSVHISTEASQFDLLALARFDGEGRFNLEAAPGDSAWPTPAERRRMQELLFSADQEPNALAT